MSRTRRTGQQKARILRNFEHTDQSAAAFCRQRGVSYQTLMNWRRSVCADLPLSEPPAFLEFELAAPHQSRAQACQRVARPRLRRHPFLADGRVEIDNNATENDIRPSAVGKKNWLFVGSLEAGKRSAVMDTLLISARNHGVDPQAYLQDIIERLPVTRPCDLDTLLPANWAAANRAAHPAIKSEHPQAA